MDWVDPRVGLVWVGLDWVGSRFFSFQWVGLGWVRSCLSASKVEAMCDGVSGWLAEQLLRTF